MAITTVGILSPGDMGHGVGTVLGQHGARVITCLAGRSERTRELARVAGIADVPSLEDLVQEADLLLSILVPSAALPAAEAVAAAIRRTGADVLYADCNAIAPSTARAVGRAIVDGGGRFADAGIFGPPPTSPGNEFATSGPAAAELAAALTRYGLTAKVIEGDVGQASALKMVYAAYTKGTQALATELLVTAELFGLTDILKSMDGSVNAHRASLARTLLTMPSKAHRWVPEMEEIARTFADVGLPPEMLQGAANLYRFVASTPIGRETPESRDRDRDLDGVVKALAEALETRAGA